MNHIVLRCATSLALVLAASASVPSVAATTAAATPPTSASASTDASSMMMSNMKTMQEQMAKIHTTTDPSQRSKLLDEHFKTMQDTMKLMMSNGMGCPMMGGGPSAQGGMMGMGANSSMQGGMMGMGGNSSARGGMMGNGNMMQMMMDQMMQHQNELQPPAK